MNVLGWLFGYEPFTGIHEYTVVMQGHDMLEQFNMGRCRNFCGYQDGTCCQGMMSLSC